VGWDSKINSTSTPEVFPLPAAPKADFAIGFVKKLTWDRHFIFLLTTAEILQPVRDWG